MNVDSLFSEFATKRILVLGDVMLDSYLRGSVSRMSPEAPVPIVNLESKDDRLGGAANVALNLTSLGAEVILCSVIGNDTGGDKITSLLEKRGLSASGIICSESRETSVKTRVIGNNQQLIRIDQERVSNLLSSEEDELINKVSELINLGVDAIILEDYNKGVLTPRVISEVIEVGNLNNVIITVDPKKENFLAYKKVTLFKPNLKELQEGLNIEFDFEVGSDSFEKAVEELESKLDNKMTFVTLSEHGVFIKKEIDSHYIPAHIRNISDVSGAGDTVISVITLCLTVDMSTDMAARIANLSGGLVCEKSGVVPIEKELLKSELQNIL